MKKFLSILLLAALSAVTSNATILFPFFVDIAPSYSEGNLPTLAEAGIKQVMYSSDTPSFYPKTFEQAIIFFKDTLPGDVKVEESKVGNMRLVTYTSLTDNKSDAIETSGYLCKIYILEQPDGSFHSAYFEVQVPDNESK